MTAVLEQIEVGEDGLPVGWPQDHGIATAGPQVLAWCETVLAQPDGENAGGPWSWRDSQARFVCGGTPSTLTGGFSGAVLKSCCPRAPGSRPWRLRWRARSLLGRSGSSAGTRSGIRSCGPSRRPM